MTIHYMSLHSGRNFWAGMVSVCYDGFMKRRSRSWAVGGLRPPVRDLEPLPLQLPLEDERYEQHGEQRQDDEEEDRPGSHVVVIDLA